MNAARFVFSPAVLLSALTWSLAAPVLAQTDDREADMFGSEQEVPAPEVAAAPADTELSQRSMELLEKDRLQVGGMMYMRYSATFFEDDLSDPTLSSPNLMDVYFDVRPNDRVRGFARGRLTYNPLITSAAPAGFDVPDELAVLLGPSPDEVDTALNQLWLKFDVGRVLFVTVGKQPVKWGSTRLWNPVDFVNQSRREPLALFDERTGVSAIKLHVPIESLAWNIVGLVLLDKADSIDRTGGALRLETVFSSVELGITGLVRKVDVLQGEDMDILYDMLSGDPLPTEESVVPRLGLDVSAGVWDLDLSGEVGASFVESTMNSAPFTAGGRDASLQATVGLGYTLKYSAEDYLVIGSEYLYNPEGYYEMSRYPLAMALRSVSPFYLGRHYAAGYVLVPAPGNWDYTSFTLSGIGCLTDESYVVRLDYRTMILTYLSLEAYGSVSLGDSRGAFRLGVPADEFYPDSPEISPQRFMAGINLRVDM